MIYKKLLFFHIPKAGGSSIEKMFLKNHAPLDFVINLIFKETKFSLWMVASMRNRGWRLFIFWLVSLFLCDLKHLWGIRLNKVLQHLTYMDIYNNQKLYLKKRKLQHYKKFCIVRNPYDRIISAYHFLGKGQTFPQFIHWVHKELDKYYRKGVDPFVVILPQWEFVINENGTNGMDITLRFETLKKDFKRFKKKYHLSTPPLPHINQRTRPTSHIQSYFTPELEEMVYHMYYWDFKMFDYERIQWENLPPPSLPQTHPNQQPHPHHPNQPPSSFSQDQLLYS